jgi:hypothetical protein
MKKRLCLIIGAAAIAFSVALASQPASADDPAPQATTKQVTTKKVVIHKRHHDAKVVQKSPYSHLEPYRSSGFVGDYPGDCAKRRAAGECMIDLGYGRCESCSIGGGGGKP